MLNGAKICDIPKNWFVKVSFLFFWTVKSVIDSKFLVKNVEQKSSELLQTFKRKLLKLN